MTPSDDTRSHLHTWMQEKPGGLIYISGPMTGWDDLNEPAFAEARHRLQNLYPMAAVISPAHLPSDDSWENMLRRDVHYVADAHALVLLKHWMRSKGARLEFELAERLGIPSYWWPSLKLAA